MKYEKNLSKGQLNGTQAFVDIEPGNFPYCGLT